MSWNTRIEVTEDETGERVKKTLEAFELTLQQSSGAAYAHEEAQEQFRAAKVAALALIQSGALGKVTNGMRVQVSLSGHANPSHEPASQYSNDSVSVYISRI